MSSDYEDVDEAVDTALEDDSDGYDVIVVGAGAAGIGIGIALAHVGIERFLIIDRDTIGSSFLHGQMRLVSLLLHFPVTQ